MDMGKSMSVFWCAVVTGMAAIACTLCGMGVQSAYAADASALPEIAPAANVIAPAGYSPAGSAFENAPAQASGQPKIIPIKLGKAFKLYYYTGGVKLLRTASVKNLKTVKKGKNKLITFKVTLKDKMVTKKKARAMNRGVKKGIETVEPVWDVRDLRTGEYIYDVVKAKVKTANVKYSKQKTIYKGTSAELKWVTKVTWTVKVVVPAKHKGIFFSFWQPNKTGSKILSDHYLLIG